MAELCAAWFWYQLGISVTGKTHGKDSLGLHILDLTQRFFLSLSKLEFHVPYLQSQLVRLIQVLIPFLQDQRQLWR